MREQDRTDRRAASRSASGLYLYRRVEPDSQHRSLRQLDCLAYSGRGDATTADEHANQRAFEATEKATKNCADSCAGRDAAGLAFDPFALNRLRHGAANRIRASVHGDLIEADGHL